MRRALAAFLLAIPLVACASSDSMGPGAAPVVSASSGDPGSGDRLQAGRALFSARCQRCHALPDPNRLAPEKWPAQISEMSRKSGLSSDQVALVTDYIVAAASRSHGAQ